jgi:ribosomal protein S18 acetylase RimI-like enzyme
MQDRADVLRIGAETAFFGQPADILMEDRAIYSDFFYAYYTDVWGEWCWVACAGQTVVGFLTGCPQTGAGYNPWLASIAPGAMWRFLRGYYRLGPRTVRYIQAVAGAWLRQEFTHVDVERYPAHLHVNVSAAWRGKGLGAALLQTFLQQLREGGVPGVHLNTTSANEAACALYEKLGFQLLQSRAMAMWRPWLGRIVQRRSYGLGL